MMNNPAKLFQILAQVENSVKNPNLSIIAGKNFSNIFSIHPKEYNKLVTIATEIASKGETPQETLIHLLQGVVLAQPYGVNKFIKSIEETLHNEFSNTINSINRWLNKEFENEQPDLFNKLTQLDYYNKNTPYSIRTSKDPIEIQKIVKQTNACTKDDPVQIFQQIISDPGTIYLLGVDRKELNSYLQEEKGMANVSYVRLYAYQNKTKSETLLSVDNMWVNNNNSKLVTSMVESLLEIANYLQVDIIDETMSKNYLARNNKQLDIYQQKEELFKLGQPTKINRYSPITISEDHSGFFLIKK